MKPMENLKNNGNCRDDLALVSRIAEGDSEAWKDFVHAYSGWALYRARIFCERHCPVRSREISCGLASLHSQMKGAPAKRGDECDDGMDTYIWILQQLSRRITRYSARNDSRLATFVWSVLNSREFYIDWMRWKYGRVF